MRLSVDCVWDEFYCIVLFLFCDSGTIFSFYVTFSTTFLLFLNKQSYSYSNLISVLDGYSVGVGK